MTSSSFEFGQDLYSDMIFRGLSYRNDGPELADARLSCYARTFAKYPPDVAVAAASKLRPDGWMPSADTLEIEMQELVQDRKDMFDALNEGHVLTVDEMKAAEKRRCGYNLAAALDKFPIWDNGTDKREKHYLACYAKLGIALKAYQAINPNPQDGIDRRQISRAENILASNFTPCPHKSEKEKQGDREAALLDHERRLKEQRQKLQTAIDDDLIAEIEGQKHV